MGIVPGSGRGLSHVGFYREADEVVKLVRTVEAFLAIIPESLAWDLGAKLQEVEYERFLRAAVLNKLRLEPGSSPHFVDEVVRFFMRRP